MFECRGINLGRDFINKGKKNVGPPVENCWCRSRQGVFKFSPAVPSLSCFSLAVSENSGRVSRAQPGLHLAVVLRRPRHLALPVLHRHVWILPGTIEFTSLLVHFWSFYLQLGMHRYPTPVLGIGSDTGVEYLPVLIKRADTMTQIPVVYRFDNFVLFVFVLQ